MRKFSRITATTGITAAFAATMFSGIASAHVVLPTTLPATTNLMVCTVHGTADTIVEGPVHREAIALNGCTTYQDLPPGDYTIGAQEEKDEPPAPCDAAPAFGSTTQDHPGYPLCFGYGYYAHHIEVDRPYQGYTDGTTGKFQPPTALIHVDAAPVQAQLGAGYNNPSSVVVPAGYNFTTDPLGIGAGKKLNFTVVLLHMHRALGHV
jgi:hypothetical protein